MLYATWIVAAASIAAALAACLSARTVSKEMKRQNESLEKQSNAYRLALSVDIVHKFDVSFNEPNFRATRSKAAKALLSKMNEGEAEDVFDFFDTVGLFVKLGALTDELAYSVFFHWINLYWIAGKHHIGSKQTETSTVWNNFRKLSETVREIERQKDPESEDLKMPENRLHEQLQEEIDLSD
jgi:hypothetical protein